MFLNEQLRRMLSRYVRGQQPMTADENTWLTRILVDYYDRDLARDLLKEPPPGATEEEAKSYKTIYGTVESLDEVFRIMQSHQDAASQARLVNETTRKILEQFLTGGEDNTPDAVRSFLMSNPNFSNVTKPEFEALVKNISKQVEETYRNRARTIARTELAIAQSKTVAQELRAQGKTHVRIYDGLGCGWRHHDDGDYANGSLRRIEDYLNYPVAHPNCVRAGYPDFFGGDGSIHVGKKDLDLFETKSLEAVSANQKSLDGMSNHLESSGGPLDLLAGSERARKYNPHHSRSDGRFISGSTGSFAERTAPLPPTLRVSNKVRPETSGFVTSDERFVASKDGEMSHDDVALALGYSGVNDALSDGGLVRVWVASDPRYLSIDGRVTDARDVFIMGADKDAVRVAAQATRRDVRGKLNFVWETLDGESGESRSVETLFSSKDLPRPIDWELKYNPNHSPTNGRFTSRAGGSGINVAGSDEEFAFLKDAQYRRIEDPATGATIDQDEGLVLLMENRGYFDKPTTLSHDEFEKADKLSLDMERGWKPGVEAERVPTSVFYRGIQDDVRGVGVEAMTQGLTDGTSRFHGVGNYGNGLYFAADQNLAARYAGSEVFDKPAGMVQRIALKPDTKVITGYALTGEAFKLHGELGRGYNNIKEHGRLATWLSYDVIHADDRIVVLNHSKLIIDKSSLVRLPREKSLDLFDIELKFNPNHDRRGRFAASSGGRDLLGDDPSTVSEEWARSLLDQRESADDERISRSGGDVILSRIVDEQWGGAGTVKVADLGNANDANLMFRGVEGSTDYHVGFIDGDRFMGKGVYGNGIYFAQGGEFKVPGSALFQDNVGNAWYKAEGYGSNVRKYRISSSAKIVDWEVLTAEHTAWLNKTEQGAVRSLTKDPGHYAALKGYDGIKSPPKKGVSQYVIFNRSVLEAHVDRQPDFSFNKSATFKYNPNHDRLGRFSHGGGGGGIDYLANGADSDLLSLLGDVDPNPPRDYRKEESNPFAEHVYSTLGYMGPIEEADHSKFADDALMWRGNNSTAFFDALAGRERDYAKMTYSPYGMHGSGIYVGDKLTASGYGVNKATFALKPGAKVMTDKQVRDERMNLLADLARKDPAGRFSDDKNHQLLHAAASDPSIYAALRGAAVYEGERYKDGTYVRTILDRRAVTMEILGKRVKGVSVKFNPNHSPTTGRFVSAHTFRDGSPSDDIKALLAKTLDPLSDAEKNSLSAYTSTSYAGINRYAWMDPSKSEIFGGRPVDNLDIMYPSDYNLRHFTIMSGALEKTKTPVDLVVSHRMKAGERFFDSNGVPMDSSSVGKTLTNKGFTSTSLSKSVHLANTNWELEVPKGSKGAYVNPISSHKDEYEIILQRGAKFKITGFETDGLVTNIKARVVGFEPLESVYRGAGSFRLPTTVGKTFSDRGFVSTSVDERRERDHSPAQHNFQGDIGEESHASARAVLHRSSRGRRVSTYTWEDGDIEVLETRDIIESSLDLRAVLSERARKHNPYHDERGRFASARGYFSGGTVNNPAPLTKAETGRIGEEIAMKYLGDTASTLNVGRNNYPIDFVSHDRVVEVKTGLSTNPKASQQWRATIGQPGKKESEWLKTATAEEKRAWNNQKRQAILERKQRAVDEVSQKLGRHLKPTTLGVIIDPHTREAHVYEFEGFHLRIGWSDKGVKEAYRASYKL